MTVLFLWTLSFSSSSIIHTEAVETSLFFKEQKVSDHLGISWAYEAFNKQLNDKDKFTQQKPSCHSLFFLCMHGSAGFSQEGLAQVLVEKFYLKLVIFQINHDHSSTVSSKTGTITILFA